MRRGSISLCMKILLNFRFLTTDDTDGMKTPIILSSLMMLEKFNDN